MNFFDYQPGSLGSMRATVGTTMGGGSALDLVTGLEEQGDGFDTLGLLRSEPVIITPQNTRDGHLDRSVVVANQVFGEQFSEMLGQTDLAAPPVFVSAPINQEIATSFAPQGVIDTKPIVVNPVPAEEAPAVRKLDMEKLSLDDDEAVEDEGVESFKVHSIPQVENEQSVASPAIESPTATEQPRMAIGEFVEPGDDVVSIDTPLDFNDHSQEFDKLDDDQESLTAFAEPSNEMPASETDVPESDFGKTGDTVSLAPNVEGPAPSSQVEPSQPDLVHSTVSVPQEELNDLANTLDVDIGGVDAASTTSAPRPDLTETDLNNLSWRIDVEQGNTDGHSRRLRPDPGLLGDHDQATMTPEEIHQQRRVEYKLEHEARMQKRHENLLRLKGIDPNDPQLKDARHPFGPFNRIRNPHHIPDIDDTPQGDDDIKPAVPNAQQPAGGLYARDFTNRVSGDNAAGASLVEFEQGLDEFAESVTATLEALGRRLQEHSSQIRTVLDIISRSV